MHSAPVPATLNDSHRQAQGWKASDIVSRVSACWEWDLGECPSFGLHHLWQRNNYDGISDALVSDVGRSSQYSAGDVSR